MLFTLAASAYLGFVGQPTDPANLIVLACGLLWMGTWLAEEVFAMGLGAKSWRDRLSNTEVFRRGTQKISRARQLTSEG